MGSSIIKVYLHGDKEDGQEQGEEIGLEGAALENFRYAFYEVEFECDVDMDTGDVTILKVDGKIVNQN